MIMEEKKVPESETAASAADESLYNTSFFHPSFASSRKQLIGLLVLPLIYTSLLMLGCLSLYFGSLISNNNLSKLSVYAVDLDGGLLGQQIIAGIKKSQAVTPAGLDWRFDTTINDTVLSQETVLDERAWAVLESNASLSQFPKPWLTEGFYAPSLLQRLHKPRPRPHHRLSVLQPTLINDYLLCLSPQPNYRQQQSRPRHARRH